VMKLICSLGHCECDGHTVHKLSQRHLTADWLAPRENDCSRMHSKVSSNWLPNYIKATRPVLEIFKMAGYFPDSPRIYRLHSFRFCLLMTTKYSTVNKTLVIQYPTCFKPYALTIHNISLGMSLFWQFTASNSSAVSSSNNNNNNRWLINP
jgi:hypothetical protein